jgi:hypothetical protein
MVADTQTIGSALIQEFKGKERVVAYLSRKLVDPETRYSAAEKLCLCVYYSCTKFRHYLLNAECIVYSKFDVIKHMLSMPILNGRKFFRLKEGLLDVQLRRSLRSPW